MKHYFWSLTKLFVLASGLAICVSHATADSKVIGRADNSFDLEERIGYVEKLVTVSSAAKRIKESCNTDAMNSYNTAQDFLQQAREAAMSAQNQAAHDALRNAIQAMMAAVQAIDRSYDMEAKQNREYQDRRSSVIALLDAHRRVSAQKGFIAEHWTLKAETDAGLADLDGLLERGQATEAMTGLNLVYANVRASVRSLRDGDTLVRRLEFASKEEEYQYELERNRAHHMLIEVLLTEKSKQPGISKLVSSFTDRSGKLAEQARQKAGDGDFEEAVRLMENSTTELVRAIRSAGINIPT